MQNKQYYWQTMQEIDKAEKELSDHKIPMPVELTKAKALAMIELIRSQVAFSITSNQDQINAILEKSKSGFMSSKPAVPELKEILTIAHDEDINLVYSIDLAVIRNILGKEYDTLILHLVPNEQAATTKKIVIPDIDFSDHAEEKKQPETVKVEEVKEEKKPDQAIMDKNRMPIFANNTRYPMDAANQKSLVSFWFSTTTVSIPIAEDTMGDIIFSVYPLQISDDAPIVDIVVVASSGTTIRAAFSRGETSAVTLKFMEYSFIIRGMWEHGKFISQIASLDNEIADKIQQTTVDHIPSKRSSYTYVQCKHDGRNYYIFPGTAGTNDLNGYAVMAIITSIPGSQEIQTFTPDANGVYTFINSDGFSEQLQAYWQGGLEPTFYADFEEA